MSSGPISIWTPGRGDKYPEAERVNAAAMEYDERLRFGFNEQNGDWVLYIKMPRDFDAFYYIDGEPVFPVLGFGNEIPTPEKAIERLAAADTLRHGTRILDKMNKDNERLQKHRDNEASAFHEEIAERIEFGLRKEGASPFGRVFFQKKDSNETR